jgi:hypothetical protein
MRDGQIVGEQAQTPWFETGAVEMGTFAEVYQEARR